MLGQIHLRRDTLTGLIADGTCGSLMIKFTKGRERKKKKKRELEMEGMREEEGEEKMAKERKGKVKKKKGKKKEKRKTLPSNQSGRAAMGSSGTVEMNILICVSSPMQQGMMDKEVGYLRICVTVLCHSYQNI